MHKIIGKIFAASIFTLSLSFLSSFTINVHAETVVLDPGHGGSDPGAIGSGYKEKDLNNRLTQKIADKLRVLGINVLFTRNPSSDIFVSLEDRVIYANSVNADLFISIHHDASTSSSANGTSTHYSSYKPGVDKQDVYVVYNGNRYRYLREGTRGYYIDYNGTEKFVSIDNSTAYDSTPSKAATDSAELAAKLATALGSLGLSDRGSRDHNLFVTRNTNMPAVLIEAGFITNPSEASIIASDSYQNIMAQRVANVISEFLAKGEKTIDQKYKEAYDATIKAQTTKNQKDLTAARILVDALHKELPKESKSLAETFSSILDKYQHPLLVKTVEAIKKAEVSVKQADINIPRDLIVDMPEVWRNSYSSAIDKIQGVFIKNVVDAINKALLSKNEADIEIANNLYNELLTVTNNDGVKTWAETVLKTEIDKLNLSHF